MLNYLRMGGWPAEWQLGGLAVSELPVSSCHPDKRQGRLMRTNYFEGGLFFGSPATRRWVLARQSESPDARTENGPRFHCADLSDTYFPMQNRLKIRSRISSV
jgi:hypothetical protein